MNTSEAARTDSNHTPTWWNNSQGIFETGEPLVVSDKGKVKAMYCPLCKGTWKAKDYDFPKFSSL